MTTAQRKPLQVVEIKTTFGGKSFYKEKKENDKLKSKKKEKRHKGDKH